jgi:WhiB family redox-sensing transcriptional regulator
MSRGPRRREDVPDGEQLHAMHEAGVTLTQLAEDYGCSVSLIQFRIDGFLGRGRYSPKVDAYDGPRAPRWPFEIPEWMDRALCAQTDPEAFYPDPDKGGSTREAKSVCARCTVSAECLDHALNHDERHGIWGGLSDRERRRLAKQLNLDTADSNLQEPA